MASASRWLDPNAVVPAVIIMAAAINPLEIRFIFTLSPANVAIGSLVVCDISRLQEPAAADPSDFLCSLNGYTWWGNEVDWVWEIKVSGVGRSLTVAARIAISTIDSMAYQ